MTTFSIEPPYDLPLTVTSGQVFRWHREADGTWLGIDGNAFFSYQESTRQCRTSVSIERARRYLGLVPDAEDRLERLRRIDRGISELALKQAGLGLMQPESLAETIISFICSSNNHLPRITGMVERLAARFGERLPTPFGEFSRMPRMEDLAHIPESELASLGFGYRSRFVIETARRLVEGPYWERQLRSLTYPDSRRMLIELPGIGRKVADCICLYGLGHAEAVPVDVHLWNAYRARFRPDLHGATLTDSRYEAIGEDMRQRFGSDAGYVQLLMYFDRQSELRKGISREDPGREARR